MADDPRTILQKADKTFSSASGGFSFFGGREDKYQNAVDLYIEAANAFIMKRDHLTAGQVFEKAASIQTSQLKEPDDAANTMVDAYKAYRNVSPDDAARCLDQAIQHYCRKGNFRRAATHKEKLGEMFENDKKDNKRAIEYYEPAATWYENDGANAQANKLWLKVADLSALLGDYYKAIENYEKVAQASISSNLMKYSVPDYFLKAGICHMATKDMVTTQRAFEKYRNMDPTFATRREHQLLVDLAAAVEQGDQELYTDKLFAYDQTSKLDNWKTALLLEIKNQIEANVEESEFS